MNAQVSKLTLLNLGQMGREYFVRTVSNEAGFSHHVARSILAEGNVSALVPTGTTPDRAEQFNTGGGLSSPRAVQNWLANRVKALSSLDRRCLFLIQDVWTKERDVCLREAATKHFFCDDGVYFFCTQDDTEIDAILAMREVRSFKMVAGFCCGVSPPMSLHPEVPYIEQLARSAIEVYLSAYDQDGLIVWQRQASTD